MWKSLVIFGFLLVACCAIPGGYVDADVEDEDVKTAAVEASRSLSHTFASKYHHKLAKVIKARKQVVAGMNYQMDIIVGMTTCRKDETEFEEAQECEFQESVSTYKKCTVTVYRNLDQKHKLVTSGCILASKKDL